MTCLLVTHMKSQIIAIANHNYPVNSTNSSQSTYTSSFAWDICHIFRHIDLPALYEN